ncbi:hypothetical protein [Hyalangium rubrum]|uniref:Uncharacterized protein n=1 Tax=Hyalangium rubrum TaxID=3103134 RepID=A0ABU5HEJ2_9BACT|nr:hypothetical protein [Hyalangium sp. s54d21]MDY7231676.1 hypothetical protein [Hyalangium sp. s54d21]
MFSGPSWLDSLIKRSGLTELAGELKARLWRDPKGEPLDSIPPVRSEHSQSSAPESIMPKKPEAKSKKTSATRSPRAKTPARAAKKAAPAARKAAPKRAAKSSQGRGAGKAATTEAVTRLVEALRAHPNQKSLISAGQQQKDQLLRSLIPLYLARSLDLEVTSGTTSRFWEELGVSYAAPNAAKALRTHTGYAQETKKGKAITSKGIKYVEQAVAQARA